jgi:haloalkane dehalogenase
VFVHGWPLSAATFRRVVAGLADRYTCHLFDLPGAGATRIGEDAPISLGGHAATVRAAIDALGLARYALVAHDSGGFIARAVAADDARVRGLVLGNTEVPGHTPLLVVLYALLARLPGGTALVRRFLATPWLRRSPLVFGNCFEEPRYADGEFAALFIDPMVRSRELAATQMKFVRSIDKSQVAGLAAVHRRIRAPVQLIWGSADPFFPVARARAMVGQFTGGATLDEIAGAKLFVHEDHATDFVAHARPFLGRCFADSSRRDVQA